jgi:hypothetical protein
MFLSGLALSVALSAQTPVNPPFPRVRLAPLVPAMEDTTRSFEEARAFVLRGGRDDLPWTPPQVEMTAGEDMTRTSLSLAFNLVWLTEDGVRQPVWFARLRAMSGDGTVERFADSRQCPGLQESLDALDALPGINPRVPGLPRPSRTPDLTDVGALTLHDNGYRIRLRGLFAGAAYSQTLEMSGGSEAPFAPVIVDSLSRLKPCWTETPPPRA